VLQSPCRLHVLFARDADIGVILRRGPSRWVQVIRWDTRYDIFEDGAWFHGRIYEDYCDVSPDGELFVYFASQQHRVHKVEKRGLAPARVESARGSRDQPVPVPLFQHATRHNRVHKDDEYGYVWTAVSRPPWLIALALWPSPCGTYPGGGRFTDNRQLTLLSPGEVAGDSTPHSKHPTPRGLVVTEGRWRDFARPASSIEIEGAQWSGRDQKDRIIFARDGKLFRRINGRDREVMDFNGRVPEPRRAPAWAEGLERCRWRKH